MSPKVRSPGFQSAPGRITGRSDAAAIRSSLRRVHVSTRLWERSLPRSHYGPMPADAQPESGDTALVAAALPNRALAPVIRAAWDAGEAVLPLNPALPAAELDRLVDLARPTHVVDADGLRTTRSDGRPVPADTAAVVCT